MFWGCGFWPGYCALEDDGGDQVFSRDRKKEITMKRIYAVLLTAAALAGLPQAMRAQQIPPPPPANWILDNFEIGAGGVSSLSSVKNVTLPATPNTDSELIGGSRY